MAERLFLGAIVPPYYMMLPPTSYTPRQNVWHGSKSVDHLWLDQNFDPSLFIR